MKKISRLVVISDHNQHEEMDMCCLNRKQTMQNNKQEIVLYGFQIIMAFFLLGGQNYVLYFFLLYKIHCILCLKGRKCIFTSFSTVNFFVRTCTYRKKYKENSNCSWKNGIKAYFGAENF